MENVNSHDGCVGCAYESKEFESDPCNVCKQNYKDFYRRATNEDRIKSMDEVEFAKFLFELFRRKADGFCLNLIECERDMKSGHPIPESRCEKCMFLWLRREYR